MDSVQYRRTLREHHYLRAHSRTAVRGSLSGRLPASKLGGKEPEFEYQVELGPSFGESTQGTLFGTFDAYQVDCDGG